MGSRKTESQVVGSTLERFETGRRKKKRFTGQVKLKFGMDKVATANGGKERGKARRVRLGQREGKEEDKKRGEAEEEK